MSFTKHDKGKPRTDLLPPQALLVLSRVLGLGAAKYGPHNWRQGAEWSRYYAALQRHLLAWWGGEDKDRESGESHLAHAGACLLFLLAYELDGLGVDDRVK